MSESENKTCHCCSKPLRYKLRLDKSIKCSYCNNLKYKEGYKLYLCSTQCPNLYWWPAEYLSPKHEIETKIVYCMEKDECSKCGKRDFPSALFVGKRVVPKDLKGMIKYLIENSVDKCINKLKRGENYKPTRKELIQLKQDLGENILQLIDDYEKIR